MPSPPLSAAAASSPRFKRCALSHSGYLRRRETVWLAAVIVHAGGVDGSAWSYVLAVNCGRVHESDRPPASA
ncbi:hypothetical protein V5799_019267 [Amblyomma americanum]|uniref:Uncharacterized protein n=1 Tax=Amblyomma americanum TaxID=6943 RepID=A0AAQ4EXR0_AMBAM